MRHTSFRRRSGLRVTGDMSRMDLRAGGPAAADPMVTLLAADDPEGIDCEVCGVRVARLTNGRPAGHAAGGYRPNVRRGLYKCEGSGVS